MTKHHDRMDRTIEINISARTVFWFFVGFVVEVAAFILASLTDIKFWIALLICLVVGFTTGLVLEKVFGRIGGQHG